MSGFSLIDACRATNYLQAAYGHELPYTYRPVTVEIIADRVALVRVKLDWETVRLVAFAGSRNRRDWEINLDRSLVDWWPRNLQHCEVHAGWLGEKEAIGEDVAEAIVHEERDNGKPDRTIWTGHSMGAALCSLFLAENDFFSVDFDTCYLFGSPRVGARSWRTWWINQGYNARTFSVVHNADVVPRVPHWLRGYRHHGRLVYIDRRDQVTVDASRMRVVDQLLRMLGDIGVPGLAGWKDHGLQAYQHALWSHCEHEEMGHA